MMKAVSIRIEDKTMKEAERLAKLSRTDKSAVVRDALEKGLDEIRLETALRLFSKGKASTGEAAEIAGVGVGELMDELTKRGIHQQLSAEELKDSTQNAQKAIE